ncbi:3' terminal RNA ribose 2'-O-methyltransferase Hen1 [Gordonia sp. HY285]|nr:3' terminal RNA ribose 2'-O-methyltransferase Hen1 [Gordonia liuliyuniae]
MTDPVFLTVSTTHRPATDLGYLLHKHPDRIQEFSEPTSTATVFYPEATAERCTAALLVEVDPIALARSRGKRSPDFALGQYVNDRPYAASSLLAVALGKIFSTARTGRCDSRQELADSAIDLEITIRAMGCRDGRKFIDRLFTPLGWQVDATPIPLDDAFPEWGDSRYFDVTLRGELRLADALNQLYVLLPVFDSAKHYWQTTAEVDKLISAGGDWLQTHPYRDTIVDRYLARTGGLDAVARARLAELDDVDATTRDDDAAPRNPTLNVRRHEAVLAEIENLRPTSVIDLGCGSGQFLSKVVRSTGIGRIAGCDVSTRELRRAADRLHVDEMTEHQSARLELFQSALTYLDPRIEGFDVAVLMEVIEHLDTARLEALEHVVFAQARPGVVLVTTPNSEYNVLYPDLVGMRHPDHRFEWTRTEFASWADRVADDHGYRTRFVGVGDADETYGSPTQMAVFTRG